jgi:hypothetical protein
MRISQGSSQNQSDECVVKQDSRLGEDGEMGGSRDDERGLSGESQDESSLLSDEQEMPAGEEARLEEGAGS